MGCIPSQRIQKSKELLVQKTTGKIATLPIQDPSSLDDYITISLLGIGKTCEVLLSLYRPKNEYRALKIIKKRFNTRYCLSEQILLQKLDHPNILKSFEMLEDSDNYYISSMYCEGGTLGKRFKSIEAFSEAEIAKIMTQVFAGLAHCVENKIVHRDIKLENLLLEKKEGFEIKIADFGLACLMNEEKVRGVCGTPHYMAPEVYCDEYDEKVDVWSAGVLMFVLAYKMFPCKCRKVGKETRPDFATLELDGEGRSKDLKELIGQLLEMDPKKRIGAKEALESPWVKFYSEAN